MKTPDDVKNWLECCKEDECFGDRENCPYTADPKLCVGVMCADTLALIQQLQAQNAEQAERIKQLEAERDAAVADLAHVKDCDTCKYDDACLTGKKDCFGCREKSCPCMTCQYEWRGVQKEE